MDPQNSAQKDDASLQIKGRRRRTDLNNRDHQCGCGKSYLSYPALYTHLKHKHGSKPPEGTMLPNNLTQKTGRGRPRRLDDDPKSAKSDEEKSVTSNEPEEALEEMLIYLDSIGNFRQLEKVVSEEQKQAYLLKNFPTELFNDSREYNNMLSYIKEITTERVKCPEQDPLNREEIDNNKNIRKTSITKILAYFLVSIGPKLNVEAYKEIAMYSMFFYRSLNLLGFNAVATYEQDMKNDDEKHAQEIKEEARNPNVLYCDESNGEQILLTANEFILQMLPKYCSALGLATEKKLAIFGSTDDRLKNAVYVTQHLSYWLYALKFTNCRLALYTEDE